MQKDTKERTFSFSEAMRGLRRIVSYVAESRREFIILCTWAIIGAVLDPLATYLFSRIIYGITNPHIIFGGVSSSIGYFIIWTLIALLALLANRAKMLRGKIVDEKAKINFFFTIDSFLLRLPLSFHKNYKTGELWDKINRAANAIPDLFSNSVVPLAPQILSVVIMLGISFFVNWIFGLIFLVGTSLYIYSIARFAIPNAFLQRKMQANYTIARGHATDTITNVRAVKDFAAEQYAHKKSVELFEKQGLTGWIAYITHVMTTSTIQQVIVFVTRAVSLFCSIIFIMNNKMTVADLVLLNAYVGNIFQPLIQLTGQWRNVQNGIIALDDAEEILNEVPENYNADPYFNLTTIEGKVSFEHVFFGYQDGQNILEDVSFNVEPGQVVALVGESGVGKSTLVDIISAFHFPTKGIVSIDNVDIRKFPLSFLRSQIAVVPQETVLFNDTVINNLRYGNFNASDEQIFEAARKAHCYDFIEKFPDKWESKVGERGLRLSVGQKQRISIARAILRNPKILILDEPTSALDAGTEKIITESFEELMLSRTTFIIAHRLSTLRRASMILVFKEGCIIESGTHSELVTKKDGEYKRFHDLQIGLHV